MERKLGNFDDVDDLSYGTTEIVHSSSQDQGSPTYTGWPTSGRHPVTVHALYNLGSLVGDAHGQATEFQTLGKAVYKILWIDRIYKEDVPAKPEFVEQSLVCLTEFEDVNLRLVSIIRRYTGSRLISDLP